MTVDSESVETCSGPEAADSLAYAAFGLYCFTLINWLGGIIGSRELARAQLTASLDLLLAGLTVRETTR